MKDKNFDDLILNLGKCNKCTKCGGCSKELYNIFKDFNVGRNIPSIWTDWYNRLDAEIMIIGQDWGPYKDMLDLYKRYMDGEAWNELIDDEKSMTKKKLDKYLKLASNGRYNTSNVYITNAIMCGRYGNSYRGDNIDLKKSTKNCEEYLKRQIDIVKPKVIATLGLYPLIAIADIFKIDIDKSLKKNILNHPIIKVDDYVIIPLYHPVAQVSNLEQLEQYSKIFEYLEKE